MLVDINSCDLNNDYFHFSNKRNIQSIMNNGLKPSVGAASKMVDDRPNVSISMGAKGIMGIINSFIYMFSNMEIKDISEEYRKYFLEISDFLSTDLVGRNLACKAVIRKLKDEVYFRIKLDESYLDIAKIGGLTGFDINLPITIDKSNIELITESGNVLSAYEFALSIYNKAKDIEVLREMNEDFFHMFENETDFSFDSLTKGMIR